MYIPPFKVMPVPPTRERAPDTPALTFPIAPMAIELPPAFRERLERLAFVPISPVSVMEPPLELIVKLWVAAAAPSIVPVMLTAAPDVVMVVLTPRVTSPVAVKVPVAEAVV